MGHLMVIRWWWVILPRQRDSLLQFRVRLGPLIYCMMDSMYISKEFREEGNQSSGPRTAIMVTGPGNIEG